ncbi:MAG: DUF2946 family protein [Rhizomicrobium sp.]
MAQSLPRLRALIALLTLIFFSTQTYLIQTHIHNLGFARAATSATQIVTSPASSKAPLDADQCPLCQEAAHSGAYVLPAIAATLATSVSFTLVPLVEVPRIFARAITHTWQGRAPPHA